MPGREWRFRAYGREDAFEIENRGTFDELVVDEWLHIEQMDQRVSWMRVGDAEIVVTIGEEGAATVEIERGAYGERRGTTRP